MRPATNSERVLIAMFLAIICAAPIIQLIAEIRRGERPQALEVFRQKPSAANLRAYEHELEDVSVVARAFRPWPQYAQFAWFSDGGEKVVIGKGGWLFYRPGVQCLVERPDARAGNKDAQEALKAIVSFRDRLAARGIQLVVMPAPNKESVYPERVTRRAKAPGLVSKEMQTVLEGLRVAGVEVVDLFQLYARAKAAESEGSPLYLTQDSHWSPMGVELAAKAIAERIVQKGWLSLGNLEYEDQTLTVTRTGDLLRMLQVPALERRTAPESIRCAQVVRCDNHQRYTDDPGSEVLVLGDSFLRIYESDEPSSAGLIAHLAKELKRPLASIVNDGGASTLVRQELNRRARVLEHKKVVVWEFVERDIRLGTEGWQDVPLPGGDGKPAALDQIKGKEPKS